LDSTFFQVLIVGKRANRGCGITVEGTAYASQQSRSTREIMDASLAPEAPDIPVQFHDKQSCSGYLGYFLLMMFINHFIFQKSALTLIIGFKDA
jgi:hypothetical protein